MQHGRRTMKTQLNRIQDDNIFHVTKDKIPQEKSRKTPKKCLHICIQFSVESPDPDIKVEQP